MRTLPEAELFVDARARLGEGPVWDARTGRLVWVDIEGRALLSTDPASGATTTLPMPLPIGIAVPRRSGGFVAALEDGFHAIDADGRTEQIAAIDTEAGRLRFNDGACDPAGRFLAGTMAYDTAPGAGALYRLDADLRVTLLLDDITISNGLGWSPDGGTMYYVDTPTRRIDAFDYDVADGAIARRRPFVDIEGDGRPDGLCVDVDGAVWVALWPGWSVRRYLADGTLDAALPVPVAKVSSCAFGGAALDTLFITSAWTALSEEEREAQPHAGSLFRAPVGVRGVPRATFAG
ncbi:MAG TPA: SMP-30/gluconolactonase/LRE family protein [Candidatus Limnocylindrales bacterium]|nr:SMP-30/gluconolactonase/LRE family protein [Candidatus Limnocylindrales bacterium]